MKAGPRDDGVMSAPDYDSEYDDYDESDYARAAESIIPSDNELENKKLDSGETPRGDESMVIKTDYGNLKSKYRYLGFGMWEVCTCSCFGTVHSTLLIETGRHYSGSRDAKIPMQGIFCLYAARIEFHP